VIQTFPITVEVQALVCNNSNFTLNTHAVELVAEMVKDAKTMCLRLISKRLIENGSNEDDELIKYLEGKIKAYEFMEQSLIKNQKV
jgi:hypothetical protein